MFFLPALATVSKPALMAYSGMACTRSRSVTPGLHLAPAHQHRLRHVQRHHAGGGAEGHQARTCGKEMPIGKRVCESPPVPTVSGNSRRLSQLWITPSPGTQGHAAAVADERRQFAVGLHVHGLG